MPINTETHYTENQSLKTFNTFGIDVTSRYLAQANSVAKLQAILADEKFQTLPKLFLGGGSNVLFTKDYEGLVIRIDIQGIEIIREDATHVWVKTGAGVNWHGFVLEAISHNWGGIENLSLIPGTVGAAPMQNIGAYGVEIKDTFDSLEALNLATGQLQTFSNTDCQFGYRESIFKHTLKGQYVITSVTFQLTKNPTIFHTSYGDIQRTLETMGVTELSVKAISDAVIHIRQSKLPDPQQVGNAGSFFKNPVISRELFTKIVEIYPQMPFYPTEDPSYIKIPAGWLIEQCHWKGMQVGACGVHPKQALVIVNYGGTSGLEIKQLAEQIQASVVEKFGIELHVEVNFI